MSDLPQRVFVFARPEALDGLDTLADTLTLVEIKPDHLLPAELTARARIAVIEVDADDPGSLARLDAVREARPNLSIIVGLKHVDLAITRLMLRKGVRDVVSMPFLVDELLPAVLEVERQNAAPMQTEEVYLAPVIAVQKAVGGSGATTLVTHLADAMARTLGDDARACIIDLDLQSGDAASYLDRRSRKSLIDLVEAGDRLDDELMRSVAIQGADSFDIVAAPADIMPIEELELGALRKVLELAQRKYDVVLLDMPGALTNWALSVLLAADQVVIVADPSIRALRQAKRKLQLLRGFDFAEDRIKLVLNHIASGLFKKVDKGGIETALGHPLTKLIQSETQVIEQAQAEGLLARTVQRRSKFAADVDALAERLLASSEED